MRLSIKLFCLILLSCTLLLSSGQAAPKDQSAKKQKSEKNALSQKKGNLGTSNDALYRHARGETIPLWMVEWGLWKWGDDFAYWNGAPKGLGSQNYSPISEAAAGHYKWIANLVKTEMREGLYSREIGSPGFYFYQVVTAKMIALRDAEKAGDKEAAKLIRQNLRAVWAYESLLAVNTPRTSTWANLSGEITTGKGNAGEYKGLTVAVAGERWKSERYLNGDEHGNFLSPWAIDWKPRWQKGWEKDLQTNGTWWQNSVASLVKTNSYEETAPPEPFGLTQKEREKLQKVVKGDPEAAKWAAGLIREHGGLWHDYTVRMRRTTEGTEIIFFLTTNGNKPGHPATSITNDGAWKTIRSTFHKGGARSMVTIENGKIIANTEPANKGTMVSMDELGGKIIYEVMIKAKDVKFSTSPKADKDKE